MRAGSFSLSMGRLNGSKALMILAYDHRHCWAIDMLFFSRGMSWSRSQPMAIAEVDEAKFSRACAVQHSTIKDCPCFDGLDGRDSVFVCFCLFSPSSSSPPRFVSSTTVVLDELH